MASRPCKADLEPLYSVGETVYTYDNVKRDPVKWVVRGRETVYQDDKLADVRYTLERFNDQGQSEETLINVHPNDIYDTADEVIKYHMDDMRQIIESCAVEIKYATDTIQRWMTQHPEATGGRQ